MTIPYQRPGAYSAYHLYVIKIDFKKIGKTREEIVSDLKEAGIGTQVHYIPVHLQPYYSERFGFKPGDYPRAEAYYQQCLSIPLFPRMSDDEVDRVIRSIKGLY
jgi:dTDP-4-amino-4,6-dideoxygalactose transaminase